MRCRTWAAAPVGGDRRPRDRSDPAQRRRHPDRTVLGPRRQGSTDTSPACRGYSVVWALEFGAHCGGVGVPEVVENAQSPLPYLAGGRDVAQRVVAIAQPDQGGGFEGPVAGLPAQEDGALVRHDRLPVVAKVLVGVAEAIAGEGGTDPVGDLLLDRQRPFAVGEGASVVALERVQPADVVEHL